MDYNQTNIEQFWQGWLKAIRKHPWRTLLLILATCVLFALILIASSYLSALGSQLASIHETVNTTTQQVATITSRLAELKVQVHQAVAVKQDVSQTVNVITKVEKEIANMKETIEQLYSRTRTDIFRASDTGGRCAFKKKGGGAIIALRLSTCPVDRSVQGIWANRILYPGSIRMFNNILVTVFEGKEPPTNDNFSVTYITDPAKTNMFATMEVRTNDLYLDGRRVEEGALP